MKIKFVFFLMFLTIFLIDIHGQRHCGSVMNLEEIQQTDSARYQRIMALENQTRSYIDNVSKRGTWLPTIVIPVVVHVVYNNTAQNISDVQINSQIQVLNEDFNRLNADASNTPSQFLSVAGQMNIEFRLAKIDPNGNITTGITRTSTSKTGFSHISDDVKFNSTDGHDAWDAKRYLNIWVCNFSNTGLMGYAQFPSDLLIKPNTDGVVISYKYFGKNDPSYPNYNKGRTTTHEVGHWLNLRHIWGDAYNCTATDFVDDTPNQYEDTYGCHSFPKTDDCSSSNPGIMFMNYMDYSYDHCMNIFTKGQVQRMYALFDLEDGIRKDILTDACYLTGTPLNLTNQIITSNHTITSLCYINVQNVTVTNGATLTLKTVGNINVQGVTVQNNSTLILDAGGEVNIDDDFEVEDGSEFEIK